MRRALLTASLLSMAIFAGLILVSGPSKTTVTYKNKPLKAWFYGAGTNFFNEKTRQATQEAIDAVGTNACPFLFANLKGKRGNGALYFKLYQALPVRLRTALPYPISGDDIQVITLRHIRQMQNFPKQQIQALADCVPSFHNPRVRLVAFNVVRAKYETDPAFSPLCRKLLDDEHPGIRLEAAICLGESGIVADPREPRLFPILLAALESKKERELSLEMRDYWYQQQPPGEPSRIRTAFPWFIPPQQKPEEEYLRERVLRAMYRLEPHMSQKQKDRLRQVIRGSPSPAL
jgi:hypothetical protein